MDLDVLDKYYRKKFNEDIFIINTKQKSVSNIGNLEENIVYETIEKDGYEIKKVNRAASLFSNICKYCKNSAVKDNDRIMYIKYGCCESCYILKEEQRNGR